MSYYFKNVLVFHKCLNFSKNVLLFLKMFTFSKNILFCQNVLLFIICLTCFLLCHILSYIDFLHIHIQPDKSNWLELAVTYTKYIYMHKVFICLRPGILIVLQEVFFKNVKVSILPPLPLKNLVTLICFQKLFSNLKEGNSILNKILERLQEDCR